MKFDKVLENTINELSKPTERLISIRKQLEEGVDKKGQPLETIEVKLDDDVLVAISQLAADYDSTFEEICWLIIEDIVESDIKGE